MGHTLATRRITDRVHLVFHQRYQRRHHDGRPLANDGRKLVAKGLSSPCWHDNKGVVTLQKAPYNRLLLTFKIIKAKYFF